MTSPSITFSRFRRSTAGINKRYDENEYVLVSFPQQGKHSIVPSACVDVDPLDKQNGMIKTFGSRKNLRIIGNGAKEAMQERASRYATFAGSEEIDLIPDHEEKDENQELIDPDFSPSSSYRTTIDGKKQCSGKERPNASSNPTSKTTTESNITTFDHDDSSDNLLVNKKVLGNRELNFDRVYSSTTNGNPTNTFDHESSLSESDEPDDRHHDDLALEKTNDVRALLKRPRRSKKRQMVPPIRNVEGPCAGCIKHQQEIIQLGKRLERLEKVIPVIKKFRSKAPSTTTSTATSSQSNAPDNDNGVFERVKMVSGIDPSHIRSTPSRPTMIMRELLRKAGHIGDKQYFKKNENLFKEFIQVKCIIHDDNLTSVWKEVVDSINRQHIDDENNRKKRISKETTAKAQSEPSVQPPSLENLDDNQEPIKSPPMQRDVDEEE